MAEAKSFFAHKTNKKYFVFLHWTKMSQRKSFSVRVKEVILKSDIHGRNQKYFHLILVEMKVSLQPFRFYWLTMVWRVFFSFLSEAFRFTKFFHLSFFFFFSFVYIIFYSSATVSMTKVKIFSWFQKMPEFSKNSKEIRFEITLTFVST